jgi:5-methyltetrahydrofolate--homocysteine methyltransferase
MRTMVQRLKPTEADFRGARYKDCTHDVRGNNDLLVLTMPDEIEAIHRVYFEAGADISETNTISSTAIAQADYGMEEFA